MLRRKQKISRIQFLSLILANAIGFIYTFISTLVTQTAGVDGWLSVFSARIIIIPIALIATSLSAKFPNKTFIQYLPEILGLVLGRIISLIFILAFIGFTALILRENAEVMSLIMPKMSIKIIIILMSILNIYLLKDGIENFARMAQLLMPIITLSILTISLVALFTCKLKNLTPTLAKGLSPVKESLISQIALAIEPILFMMMIFPNIENKNIKKPLILGSLLSGFVLTIVVITIISCFGVDLTKVFIFSFLTLSKYIQIGGITVGTEALFVVIFVLSTFLLVPTFFYPALIGLSELLNLQKEKKLIIPLSIISYFLALKPLTILHAFKLDSLLGTYIIIPLGLLIPFLWLLTKIRNLD